MRADGVTDADWSDAIARFSVGTIARVRVAMQMPFGVFVDLPDSNVRGLIRLPDLDPSGSPIAASIEGMPMVGETVEAIVIGLGQQRQVVMSRRLEHFGEFGAEEVEHQ